ncbi:hypothetical protein ACOI9F_10430, partial [Corynebacterium striatum]
TGETRLRFWALAGQPPAVVPTNRKQAVPRSRNRGTNYPRSAAQRTETHLLPLLALDCPESPERRTDLESVKWLDDGV